MTTVALSLLFPARGAAQAGDLRQAMLVAEDARDTSAPALRPLFRGLESRDLATVLLAVRGVGRFERPGLAERLLPLLSDRRPAVRAEVAHALTQAAQGLGSAGDDSLWARIRRGIRTLAGDPDPSVRAAAVLSLGRLPYRDPAEVREARTLLLARADPAAPAPVLLAGARGLEALIRLRSEIDPPDSITLARLDALASFGRGGSGLGDPVAARVRRLALAGLLAAHSADSAVLGSALGDGDTQVRRLAALTLAQAGAGLPGTREVLARALRDSAGMVRLEALRGWGARLAPEDCRSLLELTRDPSPPVALTAIDLLGVSCPGPAANDLLAAVADSLADTQRGRLAAVAVWHRGAHALIALAQRVPERGRRFLSRTGAHEAWEVRMYAARAAAEAKDLDRLLVLAGDREPNVRQAAIEGLVKVRGHADDPVFLAALDAQDYQLVRTAAGALAGSPARDRAGPALLKALARITAERRETSRDPRVALLERLKELGAPALAPALEPYLADYDPAVARLAAEVLSAWSGRPRAAAPRPLPKPALSQAEIGRLRGARLRFTMATVGGGGWFEVELYPADAPATVARVARLARGGYYDGLTFHRVVPNFVIQGGSPGANEYVGDGPYLRDELAPRSHERGTLGISTRGRDTGDAQIFVNLVDNPRLDFNYTVWGAVVAGMAVVDRILEGDVIQRVELLPRH